MLRLIKLIPAVRAQQVHDLPGHPLLQTGTDRQGLNALACHLPLILRPMRSAVLRGQIHLAVCALPSQKTMPSQVKAAQYFVSIQAIA